MTRRVTYLRSSAIALTALLGAASLAACNKSDDATVAQAGAEPALPLTVSGASPSTAAPSVDALPAARDVSIVRVENPDDQYAYLDQAYYQSDAFEDAPPDYAFDYDGVRPWVWRSANDALEFAEPLGRDGYRYYYYQPGAAYPYLVRDDGYAYAYDRGQLAVIYDPTGRALSAEEMAGRRDYAGRYLARADALYRASRNAQRQAVVAAHWAAGRAEIAAQRAQWSAARSRQNAWRSYDAAHAAEQTTYWQDERARRQQSAEAFNQWRRADYQGPPPAPAARQQAVRDNQVRQAQAQDDAARRVNAQQAQQDRRAADDQRIQADSQRRAEQDQQQQARQQQARQQQDRQQQQQAQQQRQQADQARQQAENDRRGAQDRQRQAADQRRQQSDQARQQADNQHRAEQDQQRQQAQQQRQHADQARQQADNQRRAEQDQHRQQADQQRQQQEQQRQQAQQQAQQHEQQAQQQHQQAQRQAQQQHQQAQQQAQQEHQAQPQARKEDKGQSRPAGHDEHREKDHKGG